jgi:acyl-CoA thioester hydrolase
MDKGRFFEPMRVRFVETDLQGHVFFGNYFVYFDEALSQYLHAIGYDYQDFVDSGVDFYYRHTDCDFESSAVFEEVLNVHARAAQIGNTSISFEFAAVKARNQELVATGRIIAVTVDLNTKKPVRVPDAFRTAVARYEETMVGTQL